jgi:hypothetical protein
VTGLSGGWLLEAWSGASSPSAPALVHTLAGQVAALTSMVADSTSGPSWDSVTPFLNVGITGVVLLMLVFRKGIVPEWVLRDVERRNEQLEVRLLDLENRLRDSTNLMMTQVMPVTNRAVEVTADLLDHLDEERGRRDDRRNDPRDDGRGRAARGR